MRKLVLLSLFTLLCALPTAAQTAADEDRRPEFFVGYSNLQAEGLPERNTTGSFSDDLFGERSGLHGINVEGTGYLTPRFGLTGDFSYNARSHSFAPTGGGQDVSSSTQPATGGNITNSFTTNATDFAMGLGGGLDVRVGERVSLRVFQSDYNPVFLRDRSINVLGTVGAIQPTRLESNRQDNIRLGFGVTFK